ncbi:MAG: hypothetical protein E4G96_05245 [Chrysiogenales bacterium]|nr:MAG: hypothetical protein E4G96_05245 [Chrysiogenales bacterium]
MKRLPALLLLMTIFFAAGCERTIYRSLYNSLDTLIFRAVARYVDPNRDQERSIRGAIESLFRWHRQVELQNYVATLRGLEKRMAAGLSGQDLVWVRGRIDRHRDDLFNAVADDAAAILASLDERQIDRLERLLEERVAEMGKASRSSGRVREAGRNVVRFMEFVYGPLTNRQREDVARGVEMMEDIEGVRIRMYRERQAEFIALLRGGHGSAAVKEYLARMLLEPERSYPEYYREAAARRDRAAVEGFLLFDRDLATPEQRAHAIIMIRGLAEVLEELRGG